MQPTDPTATGHAEPGERDVSTVSLDSIDLDAPVMVGEPAAPAAPPRRLPRWPFVLVGALFVLGIAVAIAWPINVPFYAMAPGPVNDTSDFVTVPDAIQDEEGNLMFLTVTYREINALEYVGALLDREIDLAPRENIRPAGVTQEELREQNLSLMEASKNNAIYVALTQLGYEVTFDGSGAVVSSVVDGSPSQGILHQGDLVVAVDGTPIEFSDELVNRLSGRAPGDMVALTVERTDEDGNVETVELDVTLAPFRTEVDGEIEEDPNRGMLGILVQNGPAEIIFPVDVVIDSRNIGGPSAGMMFTLEVINQLTDGDITHGHIIAGTGTIDGDGAVGAIGSVRQKVFAAINVGAEYVLVPSRNYDDALSAAGDDIEVVSIDTIDDALDFLDTLA